MEAWVGGLSATVGPCSSGANAHPALHAGIPKVARQHRDKSARCAPSRHLDNLSECLRRRPDTEVGEDLVKQSRRARGVSLPVVTGAALGYSASVAHKPLGRCAF